MKGFNFRGGDARGGDERRTGGWGRLKRVGRGERWYERRGGCKKEIRRTVHATQ